MQTHFPTIPLLDAKGQYCRRVTLDTALALPAVWRRINKRGHLTSVQHPAGPSLSVLMPGGSRQHFPQQVEGGRPWALKGVRGSE